MSYTQQQIDDFLTAVAAKNANPTADQINGAGIYGGHLYKQAPGSTLDAAVAKYNALDPTIDPYWVDKFRDYQNYSPDFTAGTARSDLAKSIEAQWQQDAAPSVADIAGKFAAKSLLTGLTLNAAGVPSLSKVLGDLGVPSASDLFGDLATSAKDSLSTLAEKVGIDPNTFTPTEGGIPEGESFDTSSLHTPATPSNLPTGLEELANPDSTKYNWDNIRVNGNDGSVNYNTGPTVDSGSQWLDKTLDMTGQPDALSLPDGTTVGGAPSGSEVVNNSTIKDLLPSAATVAALTPALLKTIAALTQDQPATGGAAPTLGGAGGSGSGSTGSTGAPAQTQKNALAAALLGVPQIAQVAMPVINREATSSAMPVMSNVSNLDTMDQAGSTWNQALAAQLRGR